MKLITGAFIVLLCLTVSLIFGFKHISAKTAVTTAVARHGFARLPPAQKIADIPLPEGYTRVNIQSASFAAWLRNIYLRQNNTVYLFNGQPVAQQELHYAVLDISTGHKDLQQCADAIMRLKAEYYFNTKEYSKINFEAYNFNTYAKKHGCYSHDCLLSFMETVFINCGTYTVDAMTKPVALNTVEAGDVLVKAGAPGHAMIVVDVAQNAAGEKIYLLAQSYMPAQDMHIVINPANTTLSPWYAANSKGQISTPGWVFSDTQLKKWK